MRWLKHLWPSPRFRRNERGGVAIMAAAFGMILCALTALAVDLGSVVLTARKIQGTADLAALSGARDLARAEAAATATATANLPDIQTIIVQKGRYQPDPKLSPDARFQAQATQVNSARVEITAPAHLYFGRFITGKNYWPVTRKATAALPQNEPRVMFSIGSRLAALDGGVVNGLLGALLGTKVNLTLADYNSLANVNVNLLEFSDALATRLGVSAGDYDSLLKHEATAGDLLKVIELVADKKNSALSTIAATPVATKLKLNQLIGVEADAMKGLSDHLNVDVSALDLLMATLETANTNRQLQLDLGLQAGVATVKAYVAIGERANKSPWLTVTDTQEPVISTAQARLYLEARTAQEIKELAAVDLPVFVQVASAQARLSTLRCEAPISTTLQAKTGIASVSIGQIDKSKLHQFTTPLTATETDLLYALGGLVRVSALAHVNVGDETWQNVSFSAADVDGKVVKKVRSTKFVAGTVNSLLGNLKLKLHVGALGPVLELLLNPILSGLLNTVSLLLTPVAPVLDNLIQPLLNLLGLRLGEADIQVHAIECGQNQKTPKLVG